MKRLLNNILLFLFVMLCCQNIHSQNNYDITFYIHDIDDTIIYIESYCGSKKEIADSIKIEKDGSFRWLALDYPEGMYMVKNTNGDMFSFVLSDSKKFSIEIYANGEFYINGCAENDQYFLYQKENKIYQKAMYYYKLNVQAKPELQDSLKQYVNKYMDDFNKFQKNFFETYPNNLITVISKGMKQSAPSYFFENDKLKDGMQEQYAYYYRTHYWDNFHFEDIRILYTPYFIKQFNNYISEVTPQITDSVCKYLDNFIEIADKKNGKEYADYIISWYLDNIYKTPFSFNEVIYCYLIDRYLNRVSTFLYPSEIDFHKQNVSKIRPFLPGNIMPNIVLNDFYNQKHSLYQLKNKYKVIYFFSSSCESCKKNLDDLKNFYKDYHQQYDFEIYSIDIEPDINICIKRHNEDRFDWITTHASVEELTPYNFHLDHTPEIFILDKSNKILNKTAIYKHVKQTIENDINITTNQQNKI